MLEIRCSGTPHEIGVAHGQQARTQVLGSLAFYRQLFQETCSLDWPAVRAEAERYVKPLTDLAPAYLEEIRGIAEGSGADFLDVLALNVRTEINFGLFTDTSSTSSTKPTAVRELPESDGCTSLSWYTTAGAEQKPSSSYLAQNWDWMPAQRANIVILHIDHTSSSSSSSDSAAQPLPRIATVTEAGILAKIGLNSAGVGVCLNALRCRGVDRSRLPIHLALRRVLESRSRDEAERALRATGLAGSGHVLVADAATGAVGLECTSRWVRALPMDGAGMVQHTNHVLLLNRDDPDEKDIEDSAWLADSTPRLARAKELMKAAAEADRDNGKEAAAAPSTEALFEVLKDEQGFPGSINRKQSLPKVKSETLFTIIMNLTEKRAQVTFGRPTEFTGKTILSF